ncbi:unnamed protein product [Urochloa humidicola]
MTRPGTSCIDSIAESVEDLDDLEAAPPSPPGAAARPVLALRVRGARAAPATYVAEASGARCPSCGGPMDSKAPRDAPGGRLQRAGGGGGAPDGFGGF